MPTMRPVQAATSSANPADPVSPAVGHPAQAWLPTLPWLMRGRQAPEFAGRLAHTLQSRPDAGWQAAAPLLQAAGLAATLQRRPLASVPAQWLPVALLLRSGDACVLTERHSTADGQTLCHLVLPGQDGDDVFCASAAELAAEYTGQLLLLQAAPAQPAGPGADARVTPLRSVSPLRSGLPPSALPRLDELIAADDLSAATVAAVAEAELSAGAAAAAHTAADPAAVARHDAATASLAAAVPASGVPRGAVVLALTRAVAARSAAAANGRVPATGGGLSITVGDEPAEPTGPVQPAAACSPSWMVAAEAGGASPLRRGGMGAWRASASAHVALPAWARLQGLKQAVASAAAGLRQGVQQLGQGLTASAEALAQVRLDPASLLATAAPVAPALRVEPVAGPDPVVHGAALPLAQPSPSARRVVPVLTDMVVGPAASDLWPAGAAAPISSRLQLGGDPRLWRHLAPPAAVQVLTALPVMDWPEQWPVIDLDLVAAPAAAAVADAATADDVADAAVVAADPAMAPAAPAVDTPVAGPAAMADAVAAARARKPLRPLPRNAGRVPARTQWCAVPRPQRAVVAQ